MFPKRLVNLFPLLFLATFTGWVAYRALQAPIQIKEPPTNPDSFMVDVSATRMNIDTGTPQDELFSPKMIHYPLGNTTDIALPHFVVYNPDSEPYHIYANKGQAQNGTSTIQLWDHVKIHQAAGPNNQELTMTTTALTIYPEQQYAITHQPVVIWQPGGIVHSVGLRADLKTGAIDLLSQARGQYQATPK